MTTCAAGLHLGLSVCTCLPLPSSAQCPPLLCPPTRPWRMLLSTALPWAASTLWAQIKADV